jgi:hypothetical protein
MNCPFPCGPAWPGLRVLAHPRRAVQSLMQSLMQWLMQWLMRATLPALMLAVALAAPSRAHEGHDHGEPTPAAALPALAPRAEASSELFELLVVLDGERLLVWLDRFSSNEPVAGARIEVEGQGWRAQAGVGPDGSLRLTPPKPLGAGSHALVFTVHAAADADLLEATLVVPPAAAAQGPASPTPGQGALWWPPLAAGLAALLVLVAVSWAWQRRRGAAARREAS